MEDGVGVVLVYVWDAFGVFGSGVEWCGVAVVWGGGDGGFVGVGVVGGVVIGGFGVGVGGVVFKFLNLIFGVVCLRVVKCNVVRVVLFWTVLWS